MHWSRLPQAWGQWAAAAGATAPAPADGAAASSRARCLPSRPPVRSASSALLTMQREATTPTIDCLPDVLLGQVMVLAGGYRR